MNPIKSHYTTITHYDPSNDSVGNKTAFLARPLPALPPGAFPMTLAPATVYFVYGYYRDPISLYRIMTCPRCGWHNQNDDGSPTRDSCANCGCWVDPPVPLPILDNQL